MYHCISAFKKRPFDSHETCTCSEPVYQMKMFSVGHLGEATRTNGAKRLQPNSTFRKHFNCVLELTAYSKLRPHAARAGVGWKVLSPNRHVAAPLLYALFKSAGVSLSRLRLQVVAATRIERKWTDGKWTEKQNKTTEREEEEIDGLTVSRDCKLTVNANSLRWTEAARKNWS